MSGKEQEKLPPRLERYELKFTIPMELVEPISNFASVYCSMDRYSFVSENGFYRVNNLYLDTPEYLFLKRRMENTDNRFNMRIRSYGDNPSMPYFLEIKQKIRGLVRKYRSKVEDSMWYKAYTEPGFQTRKSNIDPVEQKNQALFERMIYSYNVSPKVLTQYSRKAWVSEVDEYARVTFDIDLRFMPESRYNLIPQESEMVPCDHELLFDYGCSVILELKCYASRVPLWMIDMIKCFDLSRRSFSKYMTGVFAVLELDHYDITSRTAMINLL